METAQAREINPQLTDGETSEAPQTKPAAEALAEAATNAATYLKALAHQGRLMILCHLAMGEKSVGELETLLDIRQAAVSQMLARLREEQLVVTRRDGKTVFYSLADDKTAELIGLLHKHFCAPE